MGARDMFRRRITDEDIERFLSGKSPEDERLARLAPLAHVLKEAGGRLPDEAEIGRVAAQAARLAQIASEGAPAGRPSAERHATRPRSRVSPRLVGALGGVILLFSCTAGVAYASNGAAPGDVLYGFDRALEAIGLGAGGLEERLAEAGKLAGRDEVEQGLLHAAEALTEASESDPGAQEARRALQELANAVATASEGELTTLEARIAEMLQWMADADPEEGDFAAGVTERAQGVLTGGDDAGGREDTGPDDRPGDAPTGPPASGNSGPSPSTPGQGTSTPPDEEPDLQTGGGGTGFGSPDGQETVQGTTVQSTNSTEQQEPAGSGEPRTDSTGQSGPGNGTQGQAGK